VRRRPRGERGTKEEVKGRRGNGGAWRRGVGRSGVYADDGDEVQQNRPRDGGGIFGQTGRSTLSETSLAAFHCARRISQKEPRKIGRKVLV
jgi:hypothetical protein